MELILHVVHIVCGAFWAGAGLLLAWFVMPAARALGPDGGKFMQRLMGPGRLGAVMSVAGSLTVITGAAMLWRGAGGDLGSWWATSYGRSIVIGSIAGLGAAVIGFSVNAPSAAKLARIGGAIQAAGAPPRPEQLAEIARLQHRLHSAGKLSALLLAVSLVAMAAARYL